MGPRHTSHAYSNDLRERDAQLHKLYARLSIAKAQKNKTMRIQLEKEIRAVG
jgi:hypothetical protein